jgi:hypothetical protein
MKKLHGIRVTFWGQKRHKRNKQRVWRKSHKPVWSIMDFVFGRENYTKSTSLYREVYNKIPQRSLNRT